MPSGPFRRSADSFTRWKRTRWRSKSNRSRSAPATTTASSWGGGAQVAGAGAPVERADAHPAAATAMNPPARTAHFPRFGARCAAVLGLALAALAVRAEGTNPVPARLDYPAFKII